MHSLPGTPSLILAALVSLSTKALSFPTTTGDADPWPRPSQDQQLTNARMEGALLVRSVGCFLPSF